MYPYLSLLFLGKFQYVVDIIVVSGIVTVVKGHIWCPDTEYEEYNSNAFNNKVIGTWLLF